MSKKRGTQHLKKKPKVKRLFFGYRSTRKDNKVGAKQAHKKAMRARRMAVLQRIRRRKPRAGR